MYGRITYEGEWRNGVKHGKGKEIADQGRMIYDGFWKDNAKDGYGCQIFSNGNVYKGEWQLGKMHGKGILELNSGGTLEGERVQGNLEAVAVFTSSSGVRYTQKYENGKLLKS